MVVFFIFLEMFLQLCYYRSVFFQTYLNQRDIKFKILKSKGEVINHKRHTIIKSKTRLCIQANFWIQRK